MGFSVGVTGEGVNDMAALKRAQLGIAVPDASGAARLAADVLQTEPGIAVIVNVRVVHELTAALCS